MRMEKIPYITYKGLGLAESATTVQFLQLLSVFGWIER